MTRGGPACSPTPKGLRLPREKPAWTGEDLRLDPHARADKARRVQAMFEAIAGRYDLNNRVHSLGRDQAWRRKAVALCEVRPTDRVLDVACGTGDLALAFMQAGSASVTGLDFAEAMLAIARHKTASARQSPDPQATMVFVRGDAMDLPFEDRSFDIVAIAFGLRNVAEPVAALDEFRRVLAPGGRLMVLEFSEPRNAALRWLNRVYTRRIMPLTAAMLSGDRSGAYRYLPRSIATFSTPHQIAALFAGCGFEDISQHPMTFGVCTATVARVPLD